MSDLRERYKVEVSGPEEKGGAIRFTFKPNGIQQSRGPNGMPPSVPKFSVAVRDGSSGLAFDWCETPNDPGESREKLQEEIAARMKDRSIWIDRVTSLVSLVEQWAREMGWSTRRVEKKFDDEQIGRHWVPALLMQEDTCRILLEPIGRSTTGAEGIVDLYLMPAYDDIASLYYFANQWNLHYQPPGTKSTATVRAADTVPLSKELLEKVLAELRQHAA